ncbi:MAG TPA: hypothetical protein VFP35_02375 [Candidatus Saccharimonadales bacterium]|nr:hypothetical protein [Candidatus Saccharimonadales bacterium]
MHEAPTDQVTVYPDDITNLEYLAQINQRLVEERAAGQPKLQRTVEASTALAQLIKTQVEPRSTHPTGSAGVVIEIDRDLLPTLSISRNLGSTYTELPA